MIKSATFLQDYRCFRAGECFNFIPGVNLIVGEQGTGKSTFISSVVVLTQTIRVPRFDQLADTLKIDADNSELLSFDFERGNPRTQELQSMESIMGQFMSHGEFNGKVIANLESRLAPGTVVLMDEPDMAMSIRSCRKIAEIFKSLVKKYNCQIIAAVHNFVLIREFPTVLSFEHRRWMKPAEYAKLHMTT